MESAKGLPWDQRLPTDQADGGPFERHRDSQTSNRWTEDQEQNLHSSMRLVDRPQAARHAWESDEGFMTHSGLQSKTARMARPTRIGNIRTGTIVSRVPTLATGQADSQVLGRYT